MYRGKRTDNGKWVYGYLWMSGSKNSAYIMADGHSCTTWDDTYSEYNITGIIEVDPDSVGQWTGWQTRPNPNQVDVYDGDLFGVEDVGICKVEFKHGSWYLGDELLYEFEESDDGLIGWGVKLEGNTTDNKDLIEK